MNFVAFVESKGIPWDKFSVEHPRYKELLDEYQGKKAAEKLVRTENSIKEFIDRKNLRDVDNVGTEAILERLEKIVHYDYGIRIQKKAFDINLNRLRQTLVEKPNLDVAKIEAHILSLQHKINAFGEASELGFVNKPVRLGQYKKGDLVFHNKEYYVGRIDGTTSLKTIFEDQNDEIEYRVILPEKEEEKRMAASVNSLWLLSRLNEKQGYNSTCWKCKNIVTYQLLKCHKCVWYRCFHWGACGCTFKCPKCGGHLTKRKSNQGFFFWGCDNYPKCSYTR